MTTDALVTEEEVSALLDAPAAPGQTTPGTDKRRRVVPYNFRRPDRLSKEQVRSLYLLHDMFSHSLSSSLPIFLRTISEVTLVSVEQQAYVEYLHGLPDPTAIFTLSMHPLQGVAVVELNPSVAFPVIDRMMGGPGAGLSETRATTEIEQKILESFFKLLIDDLREAWRPHVELDLDIVQRETRPQMLQIVAPNEVVVTFIFEVQIGESRGMMSLCIPAVTLEPVIQRFNQAVYAGSREVPPAETRAILDTLANVSFPVTAELRGTEISVADICQIAPGDVLRLDRRVEQPVEICVAGVVKFDAELVAHEGHAAVRLCAFAAPDERNRHHS